MVLNLSIWACMNIQVHSAGGFTCHNKSIVAATRRTAPLRLIQCQIMESHLWPEHWPILVGQLATVIVAILRVDVDLIRL